MIQKTSDTHTLQISSTALKKNLANELVTEHDNLDNIGYLTSLREKLPIIQVFMTLSSFDMVLDSIITP